MATMSSHTIELRCCNGYGRCGSGLVWSFSAVHPGRRVVSVPHFVMDHCCYCKCKETRKNPIVHGAIWSDPFANKPDQEDYAYCENCSNRGGWNTKDPHRFFANCCFCDREFWEHSEICVLDENDPRNTVGQSGCLRCIRNHNIANEVRCKCCGHIADGYYCQGLCRDCECGCIANCPALNRSDKGV
jgi:hypothetical protein